MKFLLLSSLVLSISAQAMMCDTDSECLSQTLSLVKKARKLKSCDKEISAIQSLGTFKIQTELKASPLVTHLEACVEQTKQQTKRAKRISKLEAKLKSVFAR